MIKKIIEISIKNKLIILSLTAALLAWGIWSLRKLPLDAIPDITNKQVVVVTQSPNLSAVEMEQFVTFPVEMGMQNIPGLTNVRSVSQFGLSIVTLEFTEHTDLYFARSQVNERLPAIAADIPAGFGKPSMLPVTTGLGEIFQYVLKPTDTLLHPYTPMQLRTIQDWVIRKQLLGTPGVAEISSMGGYARQYHILLDPLLMRSAGTDIAEVMAAVEKNNTNTGAAYIERNGTNYFIRGLGLANNSEDLLNTFIRQNGTSTISLRDIGRVETGYAIRYGALTQGQTEAVGGIVLMLKGENSRQVVINVKERLKAIEKSLPPGLKIVPFIDREDLIERTISTVSKNLIEGGLIVIFVLVLLLGQWRAGLVVASVIPLSMLFAIGMMVVFGVSGNLMSLGAIDFGLIVDGAVIIVENIVHKMSQGVSHSMLIPGMSRKDSVVYKGSSQMVQSSIFGQVIILIVYLPILSLSGIEGKMFMPMALTVIFALIGAVLLSITYVPVISSLLLKDKSHHSSFSDKIVNGLFRFYVPAIRYALRHSRMIIVISAGILLISGWMFSRLGGEFIPQLDEGSYAIEVRMLPGTSLPQMMRAAWSVDSVIRKAFPDEVKQCTGKIGTGEVATDPMSIEEMDLMLTMHPPSKWKQVHSRGEFESKLKELLNTVPGIYTSIQQPISMRFNELMTGTKSDVMIKLLGPDLDSLAETGNRIVKLVNDIEGAKDVTMAKAEGLPQLFVEYRRDAMQRYGVSAEDAGNALQSAIAGKKAGIMFEGNQRFDILVKMDIPNERSLESIRNIPVRSSDGKEIPLSEIAQIDIRKGPMAVFRYAGERSVNVSLNVRERDIQSVVADIQNKMKGFHLPSGYRVEYGGQFENLVNAKQTLMIVVPVALVLIFLMLYMAFGHMSQALIIYAAIPFAASGGIFALALRGMNFSISAGVGFIALFGVAVLNGMVLISHFSELEKGGMHSSLRRVLTGVANRFRPVIMTALVASLGFLPMAVSTGSGAEVQKPLATVVIGGLITSTLLTLILLPVIYRLRIGKPNISGKAAALFLLGITLAGSASAQTELRISEPEFLQYVKSHPALLEADFRSREAGSAGKVWFTPPPMEMYMVFPKQPEIGITQNIEWPGVYGQNRRIGKTGVQLAAERKNLVAKNTQRDAAQLYQETLFRQAALLLLQRQDSLMQAAMTVARVQYGTGNISALQKMNIESQAMQSSLKLETSRAELKEMCRQLALFAGLRDTLLIPTDSFRELAAPSLNFSPESLPQVRYQLLMAGKSQQELTLLKRKSIPGLQLGVRQFNSYSQLSPNALAGIIIPLRYGQLKHMKNAAEYGFRAAQSAAEHESLTAGLQWSRAISALNSARNSLRWYQKTGLPQAAAIEQANESAYRSGQSSAWEFLFSLNNALDIRMRYLEELYRYNQNIITINTLNQ